MALGENYNNNEEKQVYRPTVYGYAMSNTESEIDVTNLSFSMWKSTLKIAIAPKIDNSGKEENPNWDRKNAAVIYLNHTKARIMAKILRGFLKDPESYNNQGAFAGQGLLTISNGEEFDKPNTPVLIIRKIGENGQVESSYAYEFKRNYHCSIKDFSEKTGDFDKDYESFDTLDIIEAIAQLETYAEAMTGSFAFSVVDNLAYSQDRTDKSLAKIASGVGVELYAQKASSSKGSYFSNNKSASNNRSTSTIDDIMGDD